MPESSLRGITFTCKTAAMIYNIIPCPKPRMTQRDRWAKRPPVLRYWAFKDACKAAGVTLPDAFKVVFYLPMPASWSKKKRAAMEGKPHQAKPDVDNLVKALQDAVLDEDSGVWSIWAQKKWAVMPSIEIIPLDDE